MGEKWARSSTGLICPSCPTDSHGSLFVRAFHRKRAGAAAALRDVLQQRPGRQRRRALHTQQGRHGEAGAWPDDRRRRIGGRQRRRIRRRHGGLRRQVRRLESLLCPSVSPSVRRLLMAGFLLGPGRRVNSRSRKGDRLAPAATPHPPPRARLMSACRGKSALAYGSTTALRDTDALRTDGSEVKSKRLCRRSRRNKLISVDRSQQRRSATRQKAARGEGSNMGGGS